MSELIQNPVVTVDDVQYELQIVCGSDYKVRIHTIKGTSRIQNVRFLTLQFLLLMMGLNNATSIYSCLWCTVKKDERCSVYLQCICILT